MALDIVYCVTYDTDSQSRNVLASPLGEEGHEVAKGWTVVILIMILDVDVTAEGGIIKLIARKGNPQPYEPSEPFSSQPFYTTCRRQAATTLGPEARQPLHRRRVQRRPIPMPSSSRAELRVGMGQTGTAPMIH